LLCVLVSRVAYDDLRGKQVIRRLSDKARSNYPAPALQTGRPAENFATSEGLL
jgi:hypothetical protein